MGLSCRNSLFQPTVERAKGRDFSRHGRGRVFLFGQSRQEGSDAIRVCPQDQAGHGIAARIALIEGQRFGRFVCGFSEGFLQVLHVLPKVSPVAPRGVLAEMAFVEQVLGEGLHNGEHLVHGILVLDSAIGRSGPVHGSKTRLQGAGVG